MATYAPFTEDIKIYKGTTFSYQFNFDESDSPLDLTTLSDIEVTFSKPGQEIFKHTVDEGDLTISGTDDNELTGTADADTMDIGKRSYDLTITFVFPDGSRDVYVDFDAEIVEGENQTAHEWNIEIDTDAETTSGEQLTGLTSRALQAVARLEDLDSRLAQVGIREYLSDGQELPNNGTNDASSLIESAVTDLGSKYDSDGIPRQIILPKGSYRLNNRIQWHPGVGIKAAGMGGTILLPYDDNSAIYGNQNNSQSVWYDDCAFEGFTIDGANQTGGDTADSWIKGIFIQFMRDSYFRRVEVKNTWMTGFGLDYLRRNVTFFQCRADNCGKNKQGSSNLGGGAGFGIATGFYDEEECAIISCRSTNNATHGFFTENKSTGPTKKPTGFSLIGSWAVGNRSGFRDSGSTGALVIGNHFINNSLEGASVAATPANDNGGVDGLMALNEFVGNGHDTNETDRCGLQLREMADGGYRILDNDFKNNGPHAIRAGGTTVFGGPVFIKGNYTTGHSESPVRLVMSDVKTEYINITNNDFVDDITDSGATYKDAIDLNTTLVLPTIKNNTAINTEIGSGNIQHVVGLNGTYASYDPVIKHNNGIDMTSGSVVNINHDVDDQTNVSNNTHRARDANIPEVGEWSDSFERADGDIAGQYTETGGFKWKERMNGSGSAQIISNELGIPDDNGHAYINNDKSDGVFEATCIDIGDNPDATLVFRYAGGLDGLEVVAQEDSSNQQWTLREVESGTPTVIANLGVTSANGDTIKVTCDGTTVTIEINGSQVYSDTVSTWSDRTAWGIRVRGADTATRWDDMKFTNL